MNILFTCHYHSDIHAGAMGVTWRLGQEYERLGHTVAYYCLDDLPARLHPLARVMLFPEFCAHRALQQSPLQVLDASTGDSWVWSRLQHLRQDGDRPLVIARCHGLEHLEHEEYLEEVRRGNLRFGWKYWWYRGSLRLWEAAQTMRLADLVLFLNQRDRQYAVDYLQVQLERAQVISNGISEAFIHQSLEPLPEDGSLRIAQIGTYIIRKGIHYGSPALNQILQRHPQIQLTFLGTQCPQAQVYEDFAPEVRDRIQVIPYYTNETLPALLRGHHIKLFPTISEGFGIALVEAMACGLVPITTRAPGPLEIVRDGHDALVVPCRDTEAIAQALERLVGDRPLLERLRHNAHATAQGYAWSNIARQNLTYYDKARDLRKAAKIPIETFS